MNSRVNVRDKISDLVVIYTRIIAQSGKLAKNSLSVAQLLIPCQFAVWILGEKGEI